MKRAGIIGGIGPESTIEYYRLLVTLYREQTQDGGYPSLIINSIDMQRMRTAIERDQLPEVTEFLLEEIARLVDAGADFGALSANTPHIVFDALRQRSSIPLISIVEVACEAAAIRGLKRLGLLGTRFTMQGRFFPDVFGRAGIALVVPALAEQDYIHQKYMGELVNGRFLPATREGMLRIVRRLREQENIDGVILGGTELPLLLRQEDEPGFLLLDTTRLHVARIVAEMIAP